MAQKAIMIGKHAAENSNAPALGVSRPHITSEKVPCHYLRCATGSTGALSRGSRPFTGCQRPSLGINLTSSVHVRAVKQVAQGEAFFLEPVFMRYYL